MIAPLAEILSSHKRHVLNFPVHTGHFLIGCSCTTFRGRLVASAWANDHIYVPTKARYENYVAPPGTPVRPGYVNSDRPPYLVQLHDDMSIESVEDIVIAPSLNGDMEGIRTNRGGFDGLKPFEWRGQLWCDFYAGGYGSVTFFLARLDGATLRDGRRLTVAGPRRDEKNWMPEVIGDELRYHYKVGILANLLQDMGTPQFHNLHGGTQVVPFDGGGLAVVHDFHYEGAGRVYRHYFVKFDADGKPVALSRAFCLTDVERVEVVTGLARHNGNLIVSNGPVLDVVSEDEFRAHMPWDGVPQPAVPPRKPPYTPPRIRVHPPLRPGVVRVPTFSRGIKA